MKGGEAIFACGFVPFCWHRWNLQRFGRESFCFYHNIKLSELTLFFKLNLLQVDVVEHVYHYLKNWNNSTTALSLVGFQMKVNVIKRQSEQLFRAQSSSLKDNGRFKSCLLHNYWWAFCWRLFTWAHLPNEASSSCQGVRNSGWIHRLFIDFLLPLNTWHVCKLVAVVC